MATRPVRKILSVWAPVIGRLLPVDDVAVCEAAPAPANVVVVALPDTVVAVVVPLLVPVVPLPVPAGVCDVVDEPEPPERVVVPPPVDAATGPLGWNGSTSADATAPVDSTTTAVIATAATRRLSNDLIATDADCTGARGPNCGIPVSIGTPLYRQAALRPSQVSAPPVPMTRIGKEAEVHGSKRCEEILRLIDEALDAFGTEAATPASRGPRQERRRPGSRATAGTASRPAA